MQFNIQVDSTSVLRTLEELGQERQGPFILARGLNLIAKHMLLFAPALKRSD